METSNKVRFWDSVNGPVKITLSPGEILTHKFRSGNKTIVREWEYDFIDEMVIFDTKEFVDKKLIKDDIQYLDLVTKDWREYPPITSSFHQEYLGV